MTRSDITAVVDEHVDAAPLLDDGGDGGPERGTVEQVEVDGQRPSARLLDQGAGGVERPGEGPGVGSGDRRRVLTLLALVARAGPDGDVEAALRQMNGYRLPDSPARSGDEGDPLPSVDPPPRFVAISRLRTRRRRSPDVTTRDTGPVPRRPLSCRAMLVLNRTRRTGRQRAR
jgi:hypothetical protein